MSKKDRVQKFANAFPAVVLKPEPKTVIAAVGTGVPVEVRTVGALVHVVLLSSRRALAVASILNRARKAALLTASQAPHSKADHEDTK